MNLILKWFKGINLFIMIYSSFDIDILYIRINHNFCPMDNGSQVK